MKRRELKGSDLLLTNSCCTNRLENILTTESDKKNVIVYIPMISLEKRLCFHRLMV